jgi:putative transcriptional regulator
MKDELFNELVASVREGGAILRGEAKPSRTFVVDGPNIKRLRAHYQLSQTKFAALFGISVGTLRNWEQGRRMPEGPARVLLQVAAKHPRAVWNVVRTAPQQLRQAAKAQPRKLRTAAHNVARDSTDRITMKRTKRPTTTRGAQAKRSAS